METKELIDYSPGPWVPAYGCKEVHDGKMEWVDGAGWTGRTPNLIATLAIVPTGSREANVRLVAAAPEMLEALIAVQAAYAHLKPFEHGDAAEKALDAVDAVIAKLTSRAEAEVAKQ